jgi:hypothetical protein
MAVLSIFSQSRDVSGNQSRVQSKLRLQTSIIIHIGQQIEDCFPQFIPGAEALIA